LKKVFGNVVQSECLSWFLLSEFEPEWYPILRNFTLLKITQPTLFSPYQPSPVQLPNLAKIDSALMNCHVRVVRHVLPTKTRSPPVTLGSGSRHLEVFNAKAIVKVSRDS
jgi:hypothetical protein